MLGVGMWPPSKYGGVAPPGIGVPKGTASGVPRCTGSPVEGPVQPFGSSSPLSRSMVNALFDGVHGRLAMVVSTMDGPDRDGHLWGTGVGGLMMDRARTLAPRDQPRADAAS